MVSTKTLIAAAVLSAFVATGCAVSNTMSEEELGLRKVNLYSEKEVVADPTSYSKVAAGESKVYQRAFENAPPMISHDVEGMLPITKANNSCLGCHSPEIAAAVKATPVPASHMYDLRNMKALKTVSPSRYNCSQCHAPQSNNAPLVENTFQPEFRSADGAAKTNLLDVLNDGVR
ncbi:MAG: nitrate reductase cytochrome c-type subunit [Sulfurospirillaceae bacterium]|nr:nitrate reductase cytochrome c-type subunit [Sulfurospirillaceae bacterium]